MCLPGWRTPGTRNLWEEFTPDNLELWRREGRGPMSSFGAEAGGFARSGADRPAPDLQFGAIPRAAAAPRARPAQRAGGRHPRRRRPGAEPGAGHAGLGRPAARPAVDPAYFADEADLAVLVAGVRMARKIAACEPLAGMIAGEIMPGEGVDDDERIRDWNGRTPRSRGRPWQRLSGLGRPGQRSGSAVQSSTAASSSSSTGAPRPS